MKILYKISLLAAFFMLAVNFAFAQIERADGLKFYEQGEYEKAAVELQKAVDADKNDQEAWLYLGMSFARLKKGNKAFKAFSKGDGIKPKEPAEKDKNLKIISKPRPRYTDAARQENVQGTIALAVEFGADGTIRFVFPIRGLPFGLTENAVSVARQIKFEPAVRDGKTISQIGLVGYSFAIY